MPMILAVLVAAKRRGWSATAVFPLSARDRVWTADFDRAGIEIHFAKPGGKLSLSRRLSYLLWEHDGPTVLHTHFTTWDIPAVLAGRRRSVSVFWHVHSSLPTGLRSRARNIAKFSTFGRRVDGILCPAPDIADGVKQRLGPRDRTVFFPSAVDVEALPLLDATARSEARSELGIRDDATVLLHFGWHWHLKGGDIYLETVRRLLASGMQGLVALERGGGEHARQEADRIGLTETVRVVPPVPDIQTLFAAADLLVASSRSEGMAYSVLEALCSGTPVVATGVPGHAYIAERVAACRIVDTEPEAIAAGVKRMLAREPQLAEAEALETRSWIVDNLSLETCSRKLLEIYERGAV